VTIVLQNQKTLNYVAAPERRTADIGPACVFNTDPEAFCFCLATDIAVLWILEKSDDTRTNLTVDVTNRWPG
jgi:hypothetical protein